MMAAPSFVGLSSVFDPTTLTVVTVVEEHYVRDACRDAGAALGCRLITAESSEQALRTINRQVDVVIIDPNRPRVTVLQLITELKARRPELELVVMSSDGTAEAVVETIKAGAFDYLVKPFTMHSLERICSAPNYYGEPLSLLYAH